MPGEILLPIADPVLHTSAALVLVVKFVINLCLGAMYLRTVCKELGAETTLLCKRLTMGHKPVTPERW